MPEIHRKKKPTGFKDISPQMGKTATDQLTVKVLLAHGYKKRKRNEKGTAILVIN